ncbi:MAG: flagellar brake protein [Exilispira sp.]
MQFFKIEQNTATTIILTIVTIAFLFVFFFVILGYARKIFYSKREEQFAYIEQTLKNKRIDDTSIKLFINILKEKKIEDPQELFISPLKLKDFIVDTALEYYYQKNNESSKTILNSLFKILNSSFIPYKGKTKILNTYGIKNNQNIVIEHKKNFFRSKVLDCTEEYILIQKVILDERINQIYTGEEINVYFYIPDDAGYMFTTQIKRDIENPKMKAFMISHSDKIYRIQKRKFIRKECTIPVSLLILRFDENTKKFSRTNIRILATILNISAGGALIEIPDLANIIDIYAGGYFLIEGSINEDNIKILASAIALDQDKNLVHTHFHKFLEDSYIAVNGFIFFSDYVSPELEKDV